MPNPIRLLVLTHNYPRFTGDYAGIFIHLLCQRLIEHDIQPIVLAPHDPGAPEEEILEGVKVFRFRYATSDDLENLAYRGGMHQLVLGSVGGAIKFRKFLNAFYISALNIIRKDKIDIVAGHWLIPAGLAMKKLQKNTRLPMILSSHGTDVRMIRKYSSMAFRYMRKFCHSLKAWTVVSNFLRNEIIQLDEGLESVLEVLPLPHDETVFFRDNTIPKEDSLVVAVTRFTEQKRVDMLIKAFALLAETRPDIRLEIYGEGPQENDIIRLIEKLGLKQNIGLFRPVPQAKLREFYNRAAVVVLNSFQEGFGLALSEAMMCGTAVIGTNSGGIPDIITHEKTGLLVEVDHPQALSDSLHLIFDDSKLRNRLAENGYQHAMQQYRSDTLAARYADMIRTIVSD